jgi:hypothetical protein
MSTAGAKLTSGPRSDDTSSRSAALDLVPFVCAIAALASILFVSVALGTHEWIQGTVLRDGKPIEAFVGLGSVRMAGETSSFGKLCPAGTKLTIPAHFETTPAGVWCKCKLAGTSGGWLLWLAYLPMWAACILSAIEGLATVVAQAKGAKARLAGMGLSQRLQGFVLIGCWVVSWLFLFLGLLAYSAAAPDTLGWGAVHFEASFGLARLAFLLVTVCTGVIIAKTLRLWQEESFGEALGDFVESRGVRRIVYIVLGVQLVRRAGARDGGGGRGGRAWRRDSHTLVACARASAVALASACLAACPPAASRPPCSLSRSRASFSRSSCSCSRRSRRSSGRRWCRSSRSTTWTRISPTCSCST